MDYEKIPIAKVATTSEMTEQEKDLEIRELRETLAEVVKILKGIYSSKRT
tara:strand:- start:234 stop:383 length:150 start_codon:yes stop_codon:yes gene_type:complete